mgnify:CR=1 FL=1
MNELIGILIQQLGVNEAQAKGGAGLLFKIAKDKLDGADFGKLQSVIPDIEALIRSAPKSGRAGALLGGLAASIGGDKMGMLAQLMGGFKSLDIDPDKVAGFVKTIASYLEAKGGDQLSALIETLKASNK